MSRISRLAAFQSLINFTHSSEGVLFLNSNRLTGAVYQNRERTQPTRRSEESVTRWAVSSFSNRIMRPHDLWFRAHAQIPLHHCRNLQLGGRTNHALIQKGTRSKADNGEWIPLSYSSDPNSCRSFTRSGADPQGNHRNSPFPDCRIGWRGGNNSDTSIF
jgi:hypothetical protein